MRNSHFSRPAETDPYDDHDNHGDIDQHDNHGDDDQHRAVGGSWVLVAESGGLKGEEGEHYSTQHLI